jgi:hypothetical protein
MTLLCCRKPVGFPVKPSSVAALQACTQRHKLMILYIIPQEQDITELNCNSQIKIWAAYSVLIEYLMQIFNAIIRNISKHFCATKIWRLCS